MSSKKDSMPWRKEGTLKVTNIPREAYPVEVEETIAAAYHGSIPVRPQRQDYDIHPSRPNGPQNFELILPEDHKSGQLKGTGTLYLPIHYTSFLDHTSSNPVFIRGAELKFEQSWTNPKTKDLTTRLAILESPYVPAKERDRVIKRRKVFEEADLCVLKLEWGRKGFSSDGLGGPRQVFNVYFQHDSSGSDGPNTTLYFADELRTILIALEDRSRSEYNTDLIRIPYTHIRSVERCEDGQSAMIFHLHSSAIFEQFPGGKTTLPRPPRLPQNPDENFTRPSGERLTGLNAKHARVLPYCYRTLRVILHEPHIWLLERMLQTAGIPIFGDWKIHLDGRTQNQFMQHDHALQNQMRALPFAVAFQIESMLLRGLLDHRQLLMLIDVVREYDHLQLPAVADGLASFAQKPYLLSQDAVLLDGDIRTTLAGHVTAHVAGSKELPTETKLGWFRCHRVTLTPTSKRLQGPFLDQGNRIIRRYDRKDWDHFIRVHFTDENGIQVRWDRHTDLEKFLQEFIGEPLRNGITVGGQHFDFLLCSNSSLREHAVWFFHPFDGHTAQSIRDSIGCFTDPKPELVFQPAKLLARMGQALSATDPTVTLQPHEVEEEVEDIERNGSCFTDGFGDISQQLADEIWRALNPNLHPGSLSRTPVAFQIRIAGAKGVVAINHTLTGRRIRLRKSMVKFKKSSSELYSVEVAKAFQYPTPCYLNRPLAMILDHLGVEHEVIVNTQYQALMDASRACTISIGSLVRLVDESGLGRPYRFYRLLVHLIKGGLHYRDLFQDSRPVTKFFERVGDAILGHLKRDVKHRARIRIPNSYTLVGVADVQAYLKPGEVFIAIQNANDTEPKYIEGPVWVTRSPAVHPGDIQPHTAIGKPPQDSPFAIQPLLNCLVFSVTASRAPACESPLSLGAGTSTGFVHPASFIDFKPDGQVKDLFQVVCDPTFFPKRRQEPAAYPPTVPHSLQDEVQIGDIINSIISWIIQDRLGLIATNHLIIADQSPRGLDDPKCMTLAELHSNAVDFAKTGVPVDFKKIPKFSAQCKPDWNSKSSSISSTMHYQSTRVIGKLFRQVKLEEKPPRSEEEFSVDEEELREHPFFDILQRRLREVFPPESNFDSTLEKTARSGWQKELGGISQKYQSELASIQTLYSLSDQPLTEEEVFLGVNLSQASERRLQDDLRARMRLITGVLVDRVQVALRGHANRVRVEQWVARSWLAWNWFYGEEEPGCQSFSWIAMLSFFDALEVHKGCRRDPADSYQPSPGWFSEPQEVEEMVDEDGDEEDVSPLVE